MKDKAAPLYETLQNTGSFSYIFSIHRKQ